MSSDLRSPTSVLRGLRVSIVTGTLGQGGAENQLFLIASTLEREGATVQVISLTKGEFWEKPLREHNVAVDFVGESRFRLRRLMEIIAAARKFRPHVLQSQHYYVNAYAAIAARVCRIPSVGAVRGDGTADFDSCGHVFRRLNMHLPHLLAINSRAAMRKMHSFGCPESKLYYLPNVIDLARFKRKNQRGNGVPMIVGVGRMGPEKRFDCFLEVIFQWRQKRRAPVRACLVGDGPLRKELEERAGRLGLLDGSVHFYGSVKDIVPIYREADLLMLTSDREGTPNVIMEAMACGLPVVATAVGDVPELVSHETSGFVFPVDDLAGFLGAVEKLMNNQPLRESMGCHGHSFIQGNHELGLLSTFLAHLYARALS